MNHIERLKEIIEREYSTSAKHVETVAVHETFDGETIWDGVFSIAIWQPLRNQKEAVRRCPKAKQRQSMCRFA